MRAFKKELESGRLTHEPGSLAGAAMDVSPSSRNAVADVAAADSSSPSASEPASHADSDAHATALVAPKRNAGAAVLTFAVVLAIVAALVALARVFVQ
jgi:hypothetical protein